MWVSGAVTRVPSPFTLNAHPPGVQRAISREQGHGGLRGVTLFLESEVPLLMSEVPLFLMSEAPLFS